MTSIADAAEPLLSRDNLTEAPAEKLLALLGGACAIGFGGLAFVLALANGGGPEWFGMKGASGALLTLLVALVFGALLLFGATQIVARPHDWSILVVAFSVVLIALGGIAGAIAGILGLFSGGVVFMRELRDKGQQRAG